MTNSALFPRRCQRGMTLLEVVVGLVIAGAFLSVILPAIVQSYARFKMAELRIRASDLAVARAETMMAGAVSETFPREGRESGLNWRIDLDPGRSQQATAASRGISLRAYRISVANEDRTPLAELSFERLHVER